MDDEGADGWIAYQLGLLFADKRGRISVAGRLSDRAARVALFLDLVLRHRILSGEDGSSMDTGATGFAPADALLRYIDEHPTGTLNDMFAVAPVRMRDVLGAGSPQRGRGLRRTVTGERPTAAEQRTRLRAISNSATFDDPATASLVALAAAVGQVSVDDLDRLYSQCGPAATIIADCYDYLVSVVVGSPGSPVC